MQKNEAGRKASAKGAPEPIKGGRWRYSVPVGIGDDGQTMRKSFYAKTARGAMEKSKEFLSK